MSDSLKAKEGRDVVAQKLGGRTGAIQPTAERFIRRDYKPVYPRCKLYGVRLTFRFPKGCPLGEPNTIEEIRSVQDRGWALLCSGSDHDIDAGLYEVNRAEACVQCVGELSNHPHVRRLRLSGRKTAEPVQISLGPTANVPARSDPAKPAGDVLPVYVPPQIRRRRKEHARHG